MKRALIVLSISLLVFACAGSVREVPLASAARHGDLAKIRSLIASGADSNALSGVNGWTPLLHAVHKNQLGSVSALIDGGADVNRHSSEGTTPLIMAAGYGNTPMVELLMRRGADPRITDRHGATALEAALTGAADIDRFTVFDCQADTVRALLRSNLQPPRTSINAAARRVARIKGCNEAVQLIAAKSR
jgi:ankyrin repeat protein